MGASLAAGWTVKPMIPGRLGTTPVLVLLGNARIGPDWPDETAGHGLAGTGRRLIHTFDIFEPEGTAQIQQRVIGRAISGPAAV